jgi:hypothetical protein
VCYNTAVEFWLIGVNALLFALDWLVKELESYYCLKRADCLIDYLDYLDAAASLNEIRATEEYRMLCK